MPRQRLTFFSGHYDSWCYLPLPASVTIDRESEQYLCATVVRAGNALASDGTLGVLCRLLALLRFGVVVRCWARNSAISARRSATYPAISEIRPAVSARCPAVSIRGSAMPALNRSTVTWSPYSASCRTAFVMACAWPGVTSRARSSLWPSRIADDDALPVAGDDLCDRSRPGISPAVGDADRRRSRVLRERSDTGPVSGTGRPS